MSTCSSHESDVAEHEGGQVGEHPNLVMPPQVDWDARFSRDPEDTTRPRRTWFTLSLYVLFNVFVPVVFGTVKMAMSLHGYSVVPTLLDYIIDVLFVAV